MSAGDVAGLLTAAVRLFVFAPLGFALRASALIPELIEEGRTQWRRQSTTARLIGRSIVRNTHPRSAVTRRTVDLVPAGLADNPSPAVAAVGDTPVPPDVDRLPIAGYGTLPAQAIVDLLAVLSSRELRMVAAFERTSRNRRTVLSKVAQLLAER